MSNDEEARWTIPLTPDGRCMLVVKWAKEGLAKVKAMLSPENVMESGCRVKKHPDCCHLCVINNDCSKLPMHVHCRCTPEPYLYALKGE